MSYQDNIDNKFPNNPPLFLGNGIPKQVCAARCNKGINLGSTLINGSYVFFTTLYKTTLFLSILSHNKSEKFSKGCRNDAPLKSSLYV